MAQESGATDSQRVVMEACLRNGVPFWWRGRGTLLVAGEGAPGVLTDIESLGETVIGLEGFELGSTIIHPRIDLIYDRDTAIRGGAVAVATEWGPDVWLDVTVQMKRDG